MFKEFVVKRLQSNVQEKDFFMRENARIYSND